MNLDELKGMWQADDQTRQYQLNERLLRDVTFKKVKSMLRETQFESIVEIIANGLFLLFTGSFIADHIGELRFLIPALFLHLLMIAGIILSVYRLVMTKRVSYDQNILSAQRDLERLRLLRAYELNSLYALIPLFALSFILIIAKYFLNIDLYQFGNMMLVFAIGSFFIGVLIIYFIRKLPNDLDKAQNFLTEIKEIESNKI
jgi:hypothetical protein